MQAFFLGRIGLAPGGGQANYPLGVGGEEYPCGRLVVGPFLWDFFLGQAKLATPAGGFSPSGWGSVTSVVGAGLK